MLSSGKIKNKTKKLARALEDANDRATVTADTVFFFFLKFAAFTKILHMIH